MLAIFYIPLFFVLVRRGVRDGLAAVRERLRASRRARRRHEARRRLLALASLAGCSMEPPLAADAAAGAAVLAGRRPLSAAQTEAPLPAVTYRDIFRDPRLQALIDAGAGQQPRPARSPPPTSPPPARRSASRAPTSFPQVDAGAASARRRHRRRTAQSTRSASAIPAFELDLFGRLALADHAPTSSGCSRPKRRPARPGSRWSPTSPTPG